MRFACNLRLIFGAISGAIFGTVLAQQWCNFGGGQLHANCTEIVSCTIAFIICSYPGINFCPAFIPKSKTAYDATSEKVPESLKIAAWTT